MKFQHSSGKETFNKSKQPLTNIFFPTAYNEIIERLENIDPLKYPSTRNFINGAVTYLSPYISRGVISLPQIMASVLKKHKPFEIQKFITELAWRQYWQRVWQAIGNNIFTDIKQPQPNVAHHKMITAIENASTGITIIDEQIQQLYATGYLHNHLRLYISSIACNIAQAHWLQPSRWMYYHLLDGDLASNSLSWQWVAGSFSSKKYYCNQENINHYTHSNQLKTFLDEPYEIITSLPIPSVLQNTYDQILTTNLPEKKVPVLKNNLPVIIYNSYNLDPLWHSNEPSNKILLLEPNHFEKYPVSENVINFIVNLSKNIKDIQIFTGNFSELKVLAGYAPIIYKTHPTCLHYEGSSEKYDELFPEITGYFSSFSSYWKKCSKKLDLK